MNELFYYPGACSLAVHIALLESSLDFTPRKVHLFQGEHLQEEYRAIHPLARVPALRLADGRVLTEVGALLHYVDDHLVVPTLPRSGWQQVRTLEWLSLFASSVHTPFAMWIRPARYTDEETAHAALKHDGLRRGWDMLEYVEKRLSDGGTVLESGFSLLDPYALVFFFWGLHAKLPVQRLARYKLLAQKLMDRPSVRQAFDKEQLQGVPELVQSLE